MKRRLCSLFVSFCMIFCLVPVLNISAEEEGVLNKSLLREIINDRNVTDLNVEDKVPKGAHTYPLSVDSSVQGFIEEDGDRVTLNMVSNDSNSKITFPDDSSHIFEKLNSLKYVDLSFELVDVSGVTNMSGMFNSCVNLEAVSLKNLDTSSVTDMSFVFCSCGNLDSSKLDLSGLDTSNVEDMSYMFSGCNFEKFVELDLSGFNVGKVSNTSCMFSYCSHLKWLNVNNWNTENLKNYEFMFDFEPVEKVHICCSDDFWNKYCINVNGIEHHWYGEDGVCEKCGHVKGGDGILDRELLRQKIEEKNITDLNTAHEVPGGAETFGLSTDGSVIGYIQDNVKLSVVPNNPNGKICFPADSSGFFETLKSLKNVYLDLDFVDMGRVEDMSGMFRGCDSLEVAQLTGLEASKATNMSSMFEGCTGLRQLFLDYFNATSVTNVSSMFSGCVNLKLLDLSGFKVEQVSNATKMFYNCSSITTLDLSEFHLCAKFATDMFSGCSALEELDLSYFDMSKVMSMSGMFRGCESLGHLLLLNWEIPIRNVTYDKMLDFGKNGVVICCTDVFWEFVCEDERALGDHKDLKPKHHSAGADGCCKFCGQPLDCGILDEDMLRSTIEETEVKKLKILLGNAPAGVETFNLSNDGSVVGYVEDRCLYVVGKDIYLPENSSSFFANLPLEEMYLAGLNTKYVRSANFMFMNCNSLKVLDAKGFDTNNLRNAIGMFKDSVNLEKFNMIGWNLESLKFANRMLDFGRDGVIVCCTDDIWEKYCLDPEVNGGHTPIHHDFVNGKCSVCDTPEGTSQVIMGGEGTITWIREETGNGKVREFGIRNDGQFEKGSIFHVRYLDGSGSEAEKAAYKEHSDNLDDEVENPVIFEIGVTKLDGTEHTYVKKAKLYTKFGDELADDNIKAVFVSPEEDDELYVGTVSGADKDHQGDYAEVILNHFSPYAIYNQKSDESNGGGGSGGDNDAESDESTGSGANMGKGSKTGDTTDYTMLYVMGVMVLLSAVAVVVLKKCGKLSK